MSELFKSKIGWLWAGIYLLIFRLTQTCVVAVSAHINAAVRHK